jgi:molecular chaperone IbpA
MSVRDFPTFDSFVLNLFPELNRAAIGFEPTMRRLFDINQNPNYNTGPTYPPYNIVNFGENRYLIELAVAGFSRDEITITHTNNELAIRGSRAENDTKSSNYLYKGLAARSFSRQFTLGDHVLVESAKLENGLLSVFLVREIPESQKPKIVPIQDGREDNHVIDAKPAVDKKIAAA